MALIVLLAVLLLACFMARHHGGLAFLVAIAGTFVYEHYGQNFTDFLCHLIPSANPWWTLRCFYLLFVVIFPLLIFFRASKGGLFGALRLVETLAFSLLITILAAPVLADMLEFDSIARVIADFLNQIKNPLLITGIILSYIDILIAKKT